MPVKNIVRGQKISAKQLENAKRMRREMTPAEKLLWKQLRANRLNGLHFRSQQIVHGYFADFYCHQQELIIEVDGDIHDSQQEYDADRADYLIGLGFRIVRFTNDEIMKNMEVVLEEIVGNCKK